jgi:argininosuccinate lyase
VSIREGRFEGQINRAFEKINASIDVDRRLFREDIRGSIAYAKALYKRGLLGPAEQDIIVKGLKSIEKEIEEGSFEFRREDEDIHMNVERRLSELIGETAYKLHTGRSRNEQVVLDERLFLLSATRDIEMRLIGLLSALYKKAKAHQKIIIPSYTHFRKDLERLGDYRKRLSVMPLGSGAAAGSTVGIDREFLREELQFARLTPNSIDAVSARDFLFEFEFVCASILVTLSRMSEDIILFSSDEIGYFSLPDDLSTTSSLMPQKKNPDSVELIRGKSARVIGNLCAVLTLMKGIPYTYNRDMQEDKEGLFDTADTAVDVLDVMREVIAGLEPNTERIRAVLDGSEGLLFATDMADYLVKKGVFFRSAHRAVGSMVKYALEQGKALNEMSLEEMRRFHRAFDEDVYGVFDYERSVNSHDVPGGTAFSRIEEELVRIGEELKRYRL